MTLGVAFWVIMLVWLLFSMAWNWPGTPIGPYGPIGNALLIFFLFMLLGWKVFGAALHA